MPISAPKIPDGLPELMRGLAKSVIKENPENLYLHAAEYFENLIRERDGTLERGYQGFNAYQVYADYKEKTREKLGLAPGKQSSVSDEGDGDADDTGSGESASKTRGRTRRRRTRKPSSAEKENPVTEVQSGAVRRDGDNERVPRRKSSELSEEAAPVSVVEEEVVKVHYNPPEAQPSARVVSAQSVEAEQAVLTALDDEQMLDSDGVSKETEEDEPMESVDDVGTAPSTADVTETEASVVVDSVPLQDLETCFMHANVDHLLEKNSDEGRFEDLQIDDSDAKNATKQKLPQQGGEDVVENAIPTDLDAMSTIQQEDGESKDGATGEAEKEGSDDAGMMQMAGDTADQIVISNDGVIGEPSAVGDQQTADTPVNTEAPEKRPQSGGKAGQSVPSGSDEIIADVAVDNLLADDQAAPVEVEQKDQNVESIKTNPDQATDNATSDAVVSHTEPMPITEQTNKIASRFNEDDENEHGSGDKALDENAIDEVDDSKGKPAEEIVPEIASKPDSEADTLAELNSNDKKSDPEAETPLSSVSQKLEEPLSRTNSKEEKDEVNLESVDASGAEVDDKLPEESPAAEDEIPAASITKLSDNMEMIEIEKEVSSPVDAEAEVVPSSESLEAPERQSDTTEDIQNVPRGNDDDVAEDAADKNDDAKGKVALTESNSSIDAITDAEVVETNKAAAQFSEPSLTNSEVPVSNLNIEPTGDDSNMEPASGSSKTEPASVDSNIKPDNEESVNPEPVSEESVNPDTVDVQIPSTKTVSQDSNESKGNPEEESVTMTSEVEEQLKSEAKTSTEEPPENPLVGEVGSADEPKDEPKDEELTSDKLANEESTIEARAEIAAITEDEKPAPESPKGEKENINEAQKEQIPESDGGDTSGEAAISVVNESSEIGMSSQPTPPEQSVTEESGTTIEDELKEQPPASTALAEIEQKDNITDVEGESGLPDVLNTQSLDEQKSAEVQEQTEETANTANEQAKEIEPSTKRASIDLSMPADTSQMEGSSKNSNVGENADTPAVGEKISSQEVVDDPPGPSPEEVMEEPCIKREVSPSTSALPEPVGEPMEKKQDQELEEIKKVDLSQLSKDSAEALFYSLKKSALENQEEKDDSVGVASNNEDNVVAAAAAAAEDDDDDDGKDVVLAEEPTVQATTDDSTKRTFTDDFLDEVPISEAEPELKEAPSDGEAVKEEPAALEAQTSLEASEKDDAFNPMVMVSMRSKQFQDQLHEREARLASEGEGASPESLTSKRPLMRRCMTEMADLSRYDDATQEDETTDGTSYVEEEDQFDGYYIGHIKNKILASSVSVADSDCFDPTRSPQEPANDETEVRTALETIASTDTESTIASQATIQQAGSKRSYLRKHSQNASSNIPYASFGNAAIDQSLDEFIEREEQNKQDEAFAEAATKIQRSYRTHKKRLLRDYHSTMRTFTEDQSAESGEEYNNSTANVIQIKLDQKRDPATAGSSGLGAVVDGGEESDSNNASLHLPLGTGGRRPMYSLNIDDYDTVARRMTLTRGVAMQRNSTPDDDSGKSTNASTDRKPSLADGDGKVLVPAPAGPETLEDSPVSAPEAVQSSRSDEREEHDTDNAGNSSQTQPTPDEPRPQNRELSTAVPKPIRTQAKVLSSHRVAPLDVQNLLLIARQRTMPVQIDSSVIRVLPKHMRKRISSAGMMSDGKRK
ncbi:titin-like [Anopheles albimanus]|uniref:titin-like n=1 Tax=Anopheles albimanus TaxID=7167 RepID=UPI00163E2595|nr:titin-like [Anopheles albimanus]